MMPQWMAAPPSQVLFTEKGLDRPLVATPVKCLGEAEAVPAGGEWKLSSKDYLMQRSAKVSAVELHRGSGLLLVAFSTGTFELYQMPSFQQLHALSVTRHRITSATFNGEIATAHFSCPHPQAR